MTKANKAWVDSLQETQMWGAKTFPRSIETKESLNMPLFFDMNWPVINHEYRNLDYSFMAAEAYWITSGSPLVEDIGPYCMHIKKYSDDGYIFNGAYGPAFLSQLNFIVETLLKDPNSRQAVMTIWHPNPIETKDHKCTVALAFNIRGGIMTTTVFMRSNDLWLGRPYDMFNFTIMTIKILTALNARFGGPPYALGQMCLHAVSSHIYYNNFEQIELLLANHDKYKVTKRIPGRCLTDWQFVVDSLLACRDKTDEQHELWGIRP